MMSRIEKRIPAMAPARGAFNPALIASFSSCIIRPKGRATHFSRLVYARACRSFRELSLRKKDALHQA
jgi:hypothetical protein